MNDRKLKNIILSAICLLLAVIGAIYQIYSSKDAITLKDYLTDYEYGEEYEKTS